MATLTQFVEQFIPCPAAIECPKMEIVSGGAVAHVCFEGSGEIRMPNNNRFEYVMHAKRGEFLHIGELIKHAQAHPNDANSQFKLLATDYRGDEWNCGYIPLNPGDTVAGTTRIAGELSSLLCATDGWRTSKCSSVEVVYDRKLRLPLPMNMTTLVRRAGEEVLMSHRSGGIDVDVLGTKIQIFNDASKDVVWGVAETSEAFNHPFAENWISEPLGMLLGELVFPRLVARNFGNGTASIWVRRAPGRPADTLFACMLGQDPLGAHEDFWQLYRELLVLVATSRDGSGDLHFEANPLSRYYQEIVLSSAATNWVICMTLSSAVEGILKLIHPNDQWRSEWSDDDLKGMRDHIVGWSGDTGIKGRMLEAVSRLAHKGATSLLSGLADEGGFGRDHVAAWKSVRNQVMHGNLVSPWPSDELQAKMGLLIELTHKLARTYVRRFSDAAKS